MTMNDGQGTQIVVQVPVTFIPVDLTTQATKKAILSAPNFRKMVNQKLITLMRAEEAEAIMESSTAQAEATRLYNRAQDLSVDLTAMPVEAQRAVGEGSGELSGLAMNIVVSKDIDEDSIMTTMRNNEQALSQEDWKYITANSTFPRVKAFAAEKITK